MTAEVIAGVAGLGLAIVTLGMAVIGLLGAVGAIRLTRCEHCGHLGVTPAHEPLVACARCRHTHLMHPLVTLHLVHGSQPEEDPLSQP